MNLPLRDLMTAHQAIWMEQFGGWLVNPDDVARWCSAFSPPTAITCGGRCLEFDSVVVLAEPDTACPDAIESSSKSGNRAGSSP